MLRNGQTTVEQQGDARTSMQEYTRSALNRKRRIDLRLKENPIPKGIYSTSARPKPGMDPLARTNPAAVKASLSVGSARDLRQIYKDPAILNCIHWDSCDGMVYIGSSSGAFACVNPGGFDVDPGPEPTQGITSIASNNSFLSFTQNSDTSKSSVFLAAKNSQTFVGCEMSQDILIQMSQWHHDKLYMATTSGIFSFDPGSEKLHKDGKFSRSAASALDSAGQHIAVGYRNGKVHLPGAGITIDHKTSVTNVKQITGKVLVTGLKDRMCLYDLRRPSSPLIEYKSYHNWACPNNGLALNPEGTMAAVAIDDGSLLIYDLSQRQPVYCPLKNNKEDEAIRSILWPSAAEVFVNDGKTLSMTCWGPQKERFPSSKPSRLPVLIDEFWQRCQDPETEFTGLGKYIRF